MLRNLGVWQAPLEQRLGSRFDQLIGCGRAEQGRKPPAAVTFRAKIEEITRKLRKLRAGVADPFERGPESAVCSDYVAIE